MSKRILVNHPGDGDWIAGRTGGVFHPYWDHSLANHDDSGLLGGFVFNNFMGNAIMVHDAGRVAHWCSRELMWMIFDYAFNQLKVGKVIAPVPANNIHALTLNLRAGFQLETQIRDVIEPGVDMLILSITKSDCRWLRLPHKSYSRNIALEVA